jgi:hypothetical protein
MEKSNHHLVSHLRYNHKSGCEGSVGKGSVGEGSVGEGSRPNGVAGPHRRTADAPFVA